MFAYNLRMQLRLDAADRLVELVEERRGPVAADEAARRLFALRHAPLGLARSLLDEVVREDARVAWRGRPPRFSSAPPAPPPPPAAPPPCRPSGTDRPGAPRRRGTARPAPRVLP